MDFFIFCFTFILLIQCIPARSFLAKHGVLLVEYLWGHHIVLLHDTTRHTASDAKKRSMATIQLSNQAALHPRQIHGALMGYE